MRTYIVVNKQTLQRYIGATTKSLRQRWIQHISAAKRGGSVRLHKDIRRIGAGAFAVSEISSHDSFEDMRREEARLIRCYGPEYNTRRSGGTNKVRGGWKLSAETRKKMSRPKSQETRARMSESSIAMTLDHRKKLSLAARNRKRTERGTFQ